MIHHDACVKVLILTLSYGGHIRRFHIMCLADIYVSTSKSSEYAHTTHVEVIADMYNVQNRLQSPTITLQEY